MPHFDILMANNNKWSAFATPTKDELKALKKLIKVEPLLLSKSIVDDSEYRVYYNDENNNLQYLYIGNDALEKQKELIQSLKNSPDFKEMVQEMVQGYVEAAIGDLIKESLSQEDLVGSIGADGAAAPESFDDYKKSLTPKPNPNWDSTEEAFAKELFENKDNEKDKSCLAAFVEINIVGDSTDEKIKQVRTARLIYRNNYHLIKNNLSSQFNYYFDCGNGTKGSFACLLKKGTEYFILTAEHNLKNGKEKGNVYYLRGADDITLQVETSDPTQDYAILKIVKQNAANLSEWIPCTATEVHGTDFYKNCIKFDDKYYKDETTKEAKGKNGCIVAHKKSIDDVVFESEVRATVELTEKISRDMNGVFTLSKVGEAGNSGGAVFGDDAKFLGVYIGKIKVEVEVEVEGKRVKQEVEKGICSPYYNSIKDKQYTIV